MPPIINDPRPAIEVLRDPNTVTLTVKQFCEIFRIGKSTATQSIQRTGHLGDGLPVIRVGKRILVPAHNVRKILGMEQ